MTEETPKYACFFCDKEGANWDKAALKVVLETFCLCKKHRKELSEKIETMPDTLNEPEWYITTKERNKPDYRERAANDGSLIE